MMFNLTSGHILCAKPYRFPKTDALKVEENIYMSCKKMVSKVHEKYLGSDCLL